jgi:hypothetical protein
LEAAPFMKWAQFITFSASPSTRANCNWFKLEVLVFIKSSMIAKQQ